MYSSVRSAALLGFLACTGPIFAQGSSQNGNLAEVRFGDGSLVRMTILQSDLEVITRYGKLTVPFHEVRKIEFGVHLPDGVGKKIDNAIRLLGSETYRDREDAAKELTLLGCYAYTPLQKASRSPDLEVAQRASHIIKRIGDKVPPQNIRTKEEDVIFTRDFTIVGQIAQPTLKAQSAHFGDLALKLCDLRTMHIRSGQSENDITVDSSRYGSDVGQWYDTGIQVDSSLRLTLTAEGQVDLWPMGPGQYITTPKGFSTTGKGGVHMAGSLVARIGDNGKVFVVGERFEGSPTEEGKLFLHIVPSPWNNASSGSYRVRINVDHVALSQR